MDLKNWLTPQKLNKNLVLEIIRLLLSEDSPKKQEPMKVKVDQKVTVAEKKNNIFDDNKENEATKFLPKRADK